MQREKSEKQLERTVEKPFFLKKLDMEIPSRPPRPPPPKNVIFKDISNSKHPSASLYDI